MPVPVPKECFSFQKSKHSNMSVQAPSKSNGVTKFSQSKLTDFTTKTQMKPPSPVQSQTCTQQVVDDEEFPFEFDDDFDEPMPVNPPR